MLSPGGSPGTNTARMRYIEWLLAQLREAGFSAEQAYHGYHALDSHILGFTIWQLGHSVGTEDTDLADLADRFPPRHVGRRLPVSRSSTSTSTWPPATTARASSNTAST